MYNMCNMPYIIVVMLWYHYQYLKQCCYSGIGICIIKAIKHPIPTNNYYDIINNFCSQTKIIIVKSQWVVQVSQCNKQKAMKIDLFKANIALSKPHWKANKQQFGEKTSLLNN